MAPYTYNGFCTAISAWNAANPSNLIFEDGTEMQQKHEIAAFLGNSLHESGEFQAAREYLQCGDSIVSGGQVLCKPCASANFDWTSKTCSTSLVTGGSYTDPYCNSALTPSTDPDGCSCGPVDEDGSNPGYVPASELFFGRGAIQTSWNYNYIDVSLVLTGSADTFCTDPDLIATNES